MTSLLPSLREKKRYLVFEVLGSSADGAVAAVTSCFTRIFGVSEAAKAGLASMKTSGNRAVVRVNRKYVDKLRAAVALTTTINNRPAILRSIVVSGMISKT